MVIGILQLDCSISLCQTNSAITSTFINCLEVVESTGLLSERTNFGCLKSLCCVSWKYILDKLDEIWNVAWHLEMSCVCKITVSKMFCTSEKKYARMGNFCRFEKRNTYIHLCYSNSINFYIDMLTNSHAIHNNASAHQ